MKIWLLFRSELVKWLRDRLVPCTNQSKNVVDRALKDFNDLKQVRGIQLQLFPQPFL